VLQGHKKDERVDLARKGGGEAAGDGGCEEGEEVIDDVCEWHSSFARFEDDQEGTGSP